MFLIIVWTDKLRWLTKCFLRAEKTWKWCPCYSYFARTPLRFTERVSPIAFINPTAHVWLFVFKNLKTWVWNELNVALLFQDVFKYNYPPLPDDDFQSPINENGLLVIDDDAESKMGEAESTSEIVPKPKKVHLSPLYVAAFWFFWNVDRFI